MKQGSNDQRSGGVKSDATVVGRGPVAFSGCLGQCASTHNLYAVECPQEIWAVRSSFRRKSRWSSGIRLEPSIRPQGDFLSFLLQKEPVCVPDSEAFNSFVGDGFLVPELKGGSEASEDDQIRKTT